MRTVFLLFLVCAAGAAPAREPSPGNLFVTSKTISVNGREAFVFDVRSETGEWGIRGEKGKALRFRLVNRTKEAITLHPHGLILPNFQDGVPYVTQEAVLPGGTFDYDFVPSQSGTYFIHSHQGFQLQRQMAAPLILQAPGKPETEKEVIVFLSDFLFESPEKEFAKLKAEAPMDMGGMKMDGAMDLNDVTYDAFLSNGRTVDDPDVVSVQAGETVRLRVINASAGSNFFLSLGNLEGTLVAVDGEDIRPVVGKEFEIAIAQRLDVLVTIPAEGGAFPILAQGEGTRMQTGIVLRTPSATLPQISQKTSTPKGAIGKNYSQEKRLHPIHPLPSQTPDRSIPVELNGSMQGYSWSINGKLWPQTDPLVVKKGERVELVFINKSMMSHPMHLHGHVFQVTEIDGLKMDGAVRDTVLVMPMSTVKVQFDATNPGLWAMHCHNLWHAAAGMMTTVNYEGFPLPGFYRKEPTIK